MIEKLPRPIQKGYAFVKTLGEERVGIYTAQASFFIVLSIFPFIMLFFNIIRITPLTEDFFISVVNQYTPTVISPLLVQIINELFAHSSSTTLSISAVIAIWSASKGVLSVMFGLYQIYDVHQGRGYIISRFISMFYTVFMLISVLISMVLLVFGNRLFRFAISLIPALADITLITIILRYFLTFTVLTLFFAIIFKFANFRHATFKKVFPGALLSALGWIVFSYAFSIYVDNFSNMTYMYGSLTAVVIMMLWTYFCIYILFIGAEINTLLHPEIASDAKSKSEPEKILDDL